MKYKWLLLILLLLMPNKVIALESINIDCKKQENLYVCKASGNFDYEVSAIDFHFSLPSYATVKSYELDSKWEGSADDNWVSLYSEVNSSGNFNIVTFMIESNKKITGGDFNIVDALVYDEKFKEHKIETHEEKIKNNNYMNLLITTICVIIILGIIILSVKVRKGDSK